MFPCVKERSMLGQAEMEPSIRMDPMLMPALQKKGVSRTSDS